LSLDRVETDVADKANNDLFDDAETIPFTGALAKAVADEKAENIDFQRPAIQNLGVDKLRGLIHRIFESIAEGNLSAQTLAKRFGLSDATFSRFASTRWSHGQNLRFSNVPDLWSNTAQVLASNPDFVETAGRAGVLATISQITESNGL